MKVWWSSFVKETSTPISQGLVVGKTFWRINSHLFLTSGNTVQVRTEKALRL